MNALTPAPLLVQHMSAPLVSVTALGRGTLTAVHRQVNVLTLMVRNRLTTLSAYPRTRRPPCFPVPGFPELGEWRALLLWRAFLGGPVLWLCSELSPCCVSQLPAVVALLASAFAVVFVRALAVAWFEVLVV